MAGIAFDEAGRVLLIERGQPPSRGRWSVPGGKVEPGETLERALIREMREETGLDVQVGPLAEIVERMSRGPSPDAASEGDAGPLHYHFVILDYLVSVVGGTLTPGSDVTEARWLSFAEAETLPLTEGLMPILRRAHARAMDATHSASAPERSRP